MMLCSCGQRRLRTVSETRSQGEGDNVYRW